MTDVNIIIANVNSISPNILGEIFAARIEDETVSNQYTWIS